MKNFFFKRLFLVTMILLGLVSLFLLMGKDRTGPILNSLEGLFIVYCGGAYLWATSNKIPSIIAIRWSIAIYFLLSLAYAVGYLGANILDFLMIYKSFVYLYLLSFLADKRLMTAKLVLKFYDLLLILFFVKYLVIVGLGISTRPVVYEENNFELMLLYALYLVRYSITKEKYMLYLIVVGMITLISLSRSSLGTYSVLALYVCYNSFKRTWVFILPVAFMVLSAVIIYVFAQRSSSLEDIDRYRFMLVFWGEVKDWNVLQWLVGAERITPLSFAACDTMSFWNGLFSYSGDGTCYSVILHSFLLRVILDHGILGLIFIVYATYQLMEKSNVNKLHIIVFLAIVILNGLSVSSFNNLFFALSMVFLMTTNRFLDNNKQIIENDTEFQPAVIVNEDSAILN